jgi:hypothetical protein
MEWLQLGVDNGLFSKPLLDELKAFVQQVKENDLSRDDALDLLDSHEFSSQIINEIIYDLI